MENANPSSLALRDEALCLEKNLEVELLLENSRSVDLLVSSYKEFEEENEEEKEEEEEDLEYFYTFPVIEELRYHEWLLKNPQPSWVNAKAQLPLDHEVRCLKVFIGHFTYECDFIVLEDTTGVIDHYLGEMVFGKPFVRESGLVYNKEKGMVMFENDNEKITFKIPHKMERFKHIDFKDVKTDFVKPFVIEGDDDDHEKTHYSDNLNLGPKYK
ncbi:hypothetical protein Tco_1008073 [Tanacetum coccineum]